MKVSIMSLPQRQPEPEIALERALDAKPLPRTDVIVRGIERSSLPAVLNVPPGPEGHETRLYLLKFVRSLAVADATRDLQKRKAANDNDPSSDLRAL